MSRPDELPEIVNITPCAPGWLARYRTEGLGQFIEEPIAAWGLQRETWGGDVIPSVVALVPEGGELVPARDAGNFEEIIFRDPTCGRYLSTPQCNSALRGIEALETLLENLSATSGARLLANEIASRQKDLRNLAAMLGREG